MRTLLSPVLLIAIAACACGRSTARPEPELPASSMLESAPDCNGPEELIPHTSQCSKFIQCVHGEPVEMACPEGLIFDSILKLCNWPTNVNPKLPAGCPDASGSTASPEPERPASSMLEYPSDCDGSEELIPHTSQCSKFIQCVHCEPVEMSCPEGLIFDSQLKLCNWPTNVNPKLPAGCPDASGSTASPEHEQSASSMLEYSSECDGSEELIPHTSECTKFIQCVHGEPVEMSCPEGLIFDNQLKLCNWPTNVSPKLPTGCPDALGF